MDLVHLFSTTKQLFENRAKKSDLSIIAHSHSKRTKENAVDISLANEETHPMNLFFLLLAMDSAVLADGFLLRWPLLQKGVHCL